MDSKDDKSDQIEDQGKVLELIGKFDHIRYHFS